MGRLAPAVVIGLLLSAATACSGPGRADRAGSPRPASPAEGEPDWFVDRAAEAGLDFTHFNGMTGKLYYAEIIGSGVALLDYDNDGDLDVFFAQGAPLEPTGARSGPASGAFASDPAPRGGRLFRNDLVVGADGTRHLHFTDVTEASGIATRGYGMGVAAGDYDNDGCVDLYVTSLGPNQLWHNNCDGTFTDVTARSGTGVSSWSVSAAFLDYDRDGWLDLFVGNYLKYSVSANVPCFSPSGRPDYCSPNVYRPVASRLFHNNRDGTFTDVTAAAGLARDFGPALGVAAADVNGDGWIDLYVANDAQPNQLWINRRDGTFEDLGLLSGTAMSARGKPKSGMGVDAGDFDNDGDEDLVVANLRGEGLDLYVNDGAGLFEEQGARAGLARPSQPYTGFGAAWLDVDNDGWLDLLVVNGAVQTLEAERQANDPFPLRQPKQLFRNLANGRFEDATRRGGAALGALEVSRGAAFGDIDNDGDIDVVVANNHGRARLLVNEIGARRHWVGIRVIGGRGGRDMVGARVAITRGDGLTLWRRARADGSYASSNDPRVIAGLGSSAAPVAVRVVWPDGSSEQWTNVPVDRYTTLRQGSSPGWARRQPPGGAR